MDTMKLVEQMSNEEVLATFGTAEDPARRGFDEATWARVLAYELVRARARLSHYRTLYTAFADSGKPYMIENLDESPNGAGVPVKLIFTDEVGDVIDVEERPDVEVWTEPALLDALSHERAVLDFLEGLLDELEPALQS